MPSGRLFCSAVLGNRLIKWEKQNWVPILHHIFKKSRDFPGGAVVKNLLARGGDTGSSPGPGRFHMPQSNYARVRHNFWACALEPANHNYWAHVSQLLKPMYLEPMLHNKRSHRNEKPAHSNEE